MTPLPEPQAGASARPWRNGHGEIFDAHGNKIAYVRWAGSMSDHTEDDEGCANAALIVQAVNSHEALVAALRLALPIIEEDEAYTRTGITSAGEAVREALRLAAPAPAQEDGR